MTNISKEAVERTVVDMELDGLTSTAKLIRALSARVGELEAALDAPNRHAYKVGVAVGKATGIPEAEERSDD